MKRTCYEITLMLLVFAGHYTVERDRSDLLGPPVNDINWLPGSMDRSSTSLYSLEVEWLKI